MNEEEVVDMLLDLFGWDTSFDSRYAALVILRRARREEPPTPDDYKAGVRR